MEDPPPKPLGFRAVFAFSPTGAVLYSQRFCSVEVRVPSNQPALPPNEAISAFVRSEVIPLLNTTQSVFSLGESMPLVVMPARNLVLGVVPLLESTTIPHVEISASFSFLTFLEAITRTCLKSVAADSRPLALAGFRQLVTQALPFGLPVIHDPYFASQLTYAGDIKRFGAGYAAVAPQAVPSWKTFLIFQRLQLDLKLREVVLGSIDGQTNQFDVFGEIRCAASINYLPDVTLTVPWIEKVESLASHVCVRKIDGPKVVFSPPTGISQLLVWRSAVDRTHPPVDGKYEIKEDEAGLRFSLTVKVHPPVKNIVAQIPFPGRGAVVKHQFQSPGGQLRMSKKEATIVWTSKLGENGSQTLGASLNFETSRTPASEKYRVYVTFKSKKRTFSGLTLAKEGVALSSASTVNVTTDVSYVTESKRYIFWETPMVGQ